MTIHKSKGLEFDAVFLPGLGSAANRGNSPMLRWLSLPTQKHGNVLLMSPIKAAHREQCALYDYLSRLDQIKSNYETQRLLYVAVTRAKSRLYLMDHSEKSSKSSFRHLLAHQEFSEGESHLAPEHSTLPLPQLMHLPLPYYQNPTLKINKSDIKNPPSSLSITTPRLIGIVAHQLLQWICDNHPLTRDEIPWNLAEYAFKKLGFDAQMQQDSLSILREQMHRLFEDKTGLWIIARHKKEQNEYELLVENQGVPVTRIIDRTFEEDNKQWIIDFKTGKEDESALEKHQNQLNEYGNYLAYRSKLSIHCGIYYLSSNHWVEWQFIVV
jgi:ATP-dependent exoDNAse (exonuclease V) beta subunit